MQRQCAAPLSSGARVQSGRVPRHGTECKARNRCNSRSVYRHGMGFPPAKCRCYKYGVANEYARQHSARPHRRGRRRRAHPRPLAPLPDPGRLRGTAGRRRQGAEPNAHPRDDRSDRARPDAARRRRAVDLPPAARGQRRDADHHADGQGRRRRPHRRPRGRRRRLPAQAVQPARAAGPHPRGAAPPPGDGSARRAVEGAADGHLRAVRVRPVACAA